MLVAPNSSKGAARRTQAPARASNLRPQEVASPVSTSNPTQPSRRSRSSRVEIRRRAHLVKHSSSHRISASSASRRRRRRTSDPPHTHTKRSSSRTRMGTSSPKRRSNSYINTILPYSSNINSSSSSTWSATKINKL